MNTAGGSSWKRSEIDRVLMTDKPESRSWAPCIRARLQPCRKREHPEGFSPCSFRRIKRVCAGVAKPGAKAKHMLPDRHGSSRALIQSLFVQGNSLCNFSLSEVYFVIQDKRISYATRWPMPRYFLDVNCINSARATSKWCLYGIRRRPRRNHGEETNWMKMIVAAVLAAKSAGRKAGGRPEGLTPRWGRRSVSAVCRVWGLTGSKKRLGPAIDCHSDRSLTVAARQTLNEPGPGGTPSGSGQGAGSRIN